MPYVVYVGLSICQSESLCNVGFPRNPFMADFKYSSLILYHYLCQITMFYIPVSVHLDLFLHGDCKFASMQ